MPEECLHEDKDIDEWTFDGREGSAWIKCMSCPKTWNANLVVNN